MEQSAGTAYNLGPTGAFRVQNSYKLQFKDELSCLWSDGNRPLATESRNLSLHFPFPDLHSKKRTSRFHVEFKNITDFN